MMNMIYAAKNENGKYEVTIRGKKLELDHPFTYGNGLVWNERDPGMSPFDSGVYGTVEDVIDLWKSMNRDLTSEEKAEFNKHPVLMGVICPQFGTEPLGENYVESLAILEKTREISKLSYEEYASLTGSFIWCNVAVPMNEVETYDLHAEFDRYSHIDSYNWNMYPEMYIPHGMRALLEDKDLVASSVNGEGWDEQIMNIKERFSF